MTMIAKRYERFVNLLSPGLFLELMIGSLNFIAIIIPVVALCIFYLIILIRNCDVCGLFMINWFADYICTLITTLIILIDSF